jgi:hypothetical protein
MCRNGDSLAQYVTVASIKVRFGTSSWRYKFYYNRKSRNYLYGGIGLGRVTCWYGEYSGNIHPSNKWSGWAPYIYVNLGGYISGGNHCGVGVELGYFYGKELSMKPCGGTEVTATSPIINFSGPVLSVNMFLWPW